MCDHICESCQDKDSSAPTFLHRLCLVTKICFRVSFRVSVNAPYLYNALQILDVGSLRVQYLLHHSIHIRPGSLYRLLSSLWTLLRLWMFCWSLSSALSPLSLPYVRPSIISDVVLSASQLPRGYQLQTNRPRVSVWGGRVTVSGRDKGGAATQRAVTVPGRGRGWGWAVADRPFGAVGRGVHAEGRAVAGGGVAEGRVAKAARWDVNGAQDWTRVRDFRKGGQHIRQVVIVV